MTREALSPAEALAIARTIAAGASSLLMDGWGRASDVRSKGHANDLVTEWDRRIEAFIVSELGARSPGVAIVAEEGGGRGGDADDRWLVDPIDGTVNFAHGLPLFAISIAYQLAGVSLAGVVAAPAMGWTFAAAQGLGATRNDEAIRVSTTDRVARSMLATGFPYDRATAVKNNFAAWEHMQRRAGACRRLGSASLDMCFVACGWLDGYWETRLHPWDLAAGAVLVTEAGGRVTAPDGGKFVTDSGDVIASNGLIHDELQAELKGRL